MKLLQKIFLLTNFFTIGISWGVNPRLKSNIDYTFYKYGYGEINTPTPIHQNIFSPNTIAKKDIPVTKFFDQADSYAFTPLESSGGLTMMGHTILGFLGTYWLLNMKSMLHEFGHACAGKLLGHKIHMIHLNRLPIFTGSVNNRVDFESNPKNPYHQLIISAAGPCMDLLSGGALLYLAFINRNNTTLDYLVPANAGLAILSSSILGNLTPNGKGNDAQHMLDAWREIQKNKRKKNEK